MHSYQGNKSLSTEMDVLRRSARKSRMERIKNEHIKKIMGVKGKPNIIDIIEKKRRQWCGHVKRMPKERIPKLIMEWIPQERRKGGRPKKKVVGRSTSSHDNKKFRTRSMKKQGGMAFGFRKTATAIIKPDRWIVMNL
jgi:hypothetical protein